MLKTFAMLIGVAFLVIGVLGFIPEYTPSGKLFGIFKVNLEVNVLHLASGVFALLCAATGDAAMKVYFVLLAFVYCGLAVVGLIEQKSMILGMLANNAPNNYLNAGIGAVSVYFGFFVNR